MNNLNEQENIPNPFQPIVLTITAEELQAEINARERERIRKQLYRSS